jgi:hypothetical protein
MPFSSISENKGPKVGWVLVPVANWTNSQSRIAVIFLSAGLKKISAAEVTVHERDVIDGRGIIAQPLRRERHQWVTLDAILFPDPLPPIDRLMILIRVDGRVDRGGHSAVPPVNLASPEDSEQLGAKAFDTGPKPWRGV